MISLLCWLCAAHAAPPSAQAFEDYTGARLVFEENDLPQGRWFERIVPLDESDRERAAVIALAQAKHFPPGSLKASGLDVVGIFAAVGSLRNDGYHQWDERLKGYAYYGMYDGSHAVIAAHYTDGQLPLTLQHEWYHHLDSVARSDDDARFSQVIAGESRYEALPINEADLALLRSKRTSDKPVLVNAVSEYAAKNANEDQAETARHLHANLVDGLLQMAERPQLPGSQRMLHVLAEYEAAGMSTAWLVDEALERDHLAGHARVRPQGRWRVHGGEDERGVNVTLRSDVRRLGEEGAATHEARSQLQQLALIADYHGWIASRWDVTPGTRAAFTDATDQIIDALPASHQTLSSVLRHASLEELAQLLDSNAPPPRHPTNDIVRDAAVLGLRTNPYISNVDEELRGTFRDAVRAVQPATVRVSMPGGAGSGVNIAASGVILTAGHVPDAVGRTGEVTFPDGTTVRATCIAYDGELDLALMQVQGGMDLPFATMAARQPEIGSAVAIVGQPGTRTPNGQPTGYQPFHVSVGEIRGRASNPLANQSLGGTAHDAWTYWGHSGSPLFDRQGNIVALHNSWNSSNAMRHAVTWQALDLFLDQHLPAASRR